MSKRSPFDYVKSINEKKYEYDLAGYNPFLTNRCFAMHMDTVLYAEEMNQARDIAPSLQYDFYYYAVRQGRRFGFPPKVEDDHRLSIVMNYYQYSRQKAVEAMRVLSDADIMEISRKLDKGGNT
jgi:hypothetical protein